MFSMLNLFNFIKDVIIPNELLIIINFYQYVKQYLGR